MYKFDYSKVEDEVRWEEFTKCVVAEFGEDLSLNEPGRHAYRYAVKFSWFMDCKTMTVVSQNAKLVFEGNEVVGRKPEPYGDVTVHFSTPQGRQATRAVELAEHRDESTFDGFQALRDDGMTVDEAVEYMKDQAAEDFNDWYEARLEDLEQN